MSVTSEFVNDWLHRAADGFERWADEEEIQSHELYGRATDLARSADERRRKAKEFREQAGPRIAPATAEDAA